MPISCTLLFASLRNWPPFEDLSDGVIHQMTSISRTEYFNYNKFVISDARTNENLCFVVKVTWATALYKQLNLYLLKDARKKCMNDKPFEL